MRIIEVKEDKKQYLDLLLLADEQENMIDRYLDKGKMYVLDDNGIKCECIVTDEGNDVLEIKNIATVPDYQGKGYAKSLIDFIVEKYRKQYAILQVGTGDSPLTIPFMKSVGLSVRISYQISLQIITTIQYMRMEYSWWIWCICKGSYKETSSLSGR